MRDKTLKEAIMILNSIVEKLPKTFTHQVAHTIQPLPTERKIDQIIVEIYNGEGLKWVLVPLLIDPDQTRVMVNDFPTAFLTGRPEDEGKPCRMQLEIRYKDVPIRGW